MLGNILFNYGAQIFLALAGIVTLPFLLGKMGPELYAFVGISFTIQTIFSALDGGLSGSIAREFAIKRSNKVDLLSPKLLLKKIEPVFFGLAALALLTTAIASGSVAEYWLKMSAVSQEDAQLYLILIGAAASIRLSGGLYRSVLIGYELQKTLSAVNILSTAFRYYLVLIIVDHFSKSGHVYFYYQLLASVIELAALSFFAKRVVGGSNHKVADSKQFAAELKSILRKSFQIWILTIIWVASNQLDKVLLSGNLALREYGYFSVVATLAAGILMLGSPITSAAMPRIALLYNDEAYVECKRVYLHVSELLSTITLPISLTLISGAQHILFLMTKDLDASKYYAPVLGGYTAGSAMLLFSGLSFLLQYAGGNLGRHLRLNTIYLLLLTPSMLVAIHYFSVMGAALAWFIVNSLWTILAVRPLNQLPGMNLHSEWLISTLAKPLLFCLPSLAIAFYFVPAPTSSTASFAVLAICFALFAAPLTLRFYSRRPRQ